MPDSPGRLIAGQYRLIEQVGRGGFAVVWRAHDDRLRRDVAAKQLFLPPHFTDEQRDEHRERTLREARSVARLAHPGVVAVHDVVEHDAAPWIIMEFVHGRTLGQLVRDDGPLPPARVAEIGLRLLDALAAAHAAGIIHRDVKPSNVILGDRRVVLGDFGIAQVEGEPELTGSGFVMGAPSYTAPERARGEPAVAASDLWSLGATLFYAVEGRRAFRGPNANATFHAILTGEPAPAHRAGPLTPVLTGLLRKDPAARMSAAEAGELLTAITASLPTDIAASQTAGPLTNVAASVATSRHRTIGFLADIATSPRRTLGLLPTTGRRRPVVAGASLTALAFLLAGNALEGGHRPATSLRAPAVPRLAAVFAAGTGTVFSVAFSPDGRTLATGGTDHAVRLWNVARRRLAGVLAGHHHPVATAAFSPDGRTLATGGDDGTVILWNPGTRLRVATITTLTPGRTLDRRLLAATMGPRQTATARTVGLWNATRPTAFTPDGRTLAYATGPTVLLWNATAGPSTFDAKSRTVSALAFSPDGGLLATGGDDARVRLWTLTRRPSGGA